MASVDKPSLHYPYTETPKPGYIKEVVEGIYWVRMPMPFALDHINLWLLREKDGWTLVDTGVATDDITGHWMTLRENLNTNMPLKRLIVTHMHPDHVGLAGWMCRDECTELWMSHGEYMHCRVLLQDTNREAPDEAVDFYRAAGFDELQIELYCAQFGSFGKWIRAMPNSFRRLSEGNIFSINGYNWRVIVGYGHSPEHVCLLCEELGVFIAGDQLLPTISSNVSAWPIEPYANPLKLWLESCHRLIDVVPEDVLVLPSHGLPFRGAHTRLKALINEHETDLKNLHERCATPIRAIDTFDLLFKSSITKHSLIMATGESLAHLNCLMERGLVEVEMDDQGVNWYRQTGA